MSRVVKAGLLLAAVVAVSAVAMLPSATSLISPAATKSLSHCGVNGVIGANWDFCYRLDVSRGQGLELLSVNYQGVQVFSEVGFPFSITKYHNDTYGPFKDILGASSSTVPGYGYGALTLTPAQCPRFLGGLGLLQAEGRVCVENVGGPDPRVAIWSRFDIANYRFIQGYMLHNDGTFKPFVMLGGQLVDSSSDPCLTRGGSRCLPHHHYLYWRMDVDLADAENDRVQEFRYLDLSNTGQNSASLPACPSTTTSWCALGNESARTRSFGDHMKWRVVDLTEPNSRNHPKSIEFLSGSPGPSDAVSTRDFWALAAPTGSSPELGYEVPTTPTSDAPIEAYADGASLGPGDVVVWYAEKVYHEPRDEETPSMMYHTTGPTIRVRNFLASNNVGSSYP